jgi:hypothetical protein
MMNDPFHNFQDLPHHEHSFTIPVGCQGHFWAVQVSLHFSSSRELVYKMKAF